MNENGVLCKLHLPADVKMPFSNIQSYKTSGKCLTRLDIVQKGLRREEQPLNSNEVNLLIISLTWEVVLVYLDDIIMFALMFDKFLECLEAMFLRLVEADPQLKLNKCFFGYDTVWYLGHVISKEGIAPDPENVRALREFPVPTTRKAS